MTILNDRTRTLDIPPSTVSSELKKFIDLNYIEFHITAKGLHNGRFSHYIIPPNGISFLKILKGALELPIRHKKENYKVDEGI